MADRKSPSPTIQYATDETLKATKLALLLHGAAFRELAKR